MDATKPSNFKRGLVNFLARFGMCLFILFLASYFYFRAYNPTVPNAQAGYIYLKNLQGVEVYLTKFQIYLLDYGALIALLPFFIGACLDVHWRLFEKPYKGKPNKIK